MRLCQSALQPVRGVYVLIHGNNIVSSHLKADKVFDVWG